MALKEVKKYYLIPEDRYRSLFQKDFTAEDIQKGGEGNKTEEITQPSGKDSISQKVTDPIEKDPTSEEISQPIEKDPIIEKENSKEISQPISSKENKEQLLKSKIGPPPGIPVKKKRKRSISWISL